MNNEFTGVDGEGEFYTYLYLIVAANHIINDNRETGEAYRNMIVMVLSALIIEAYLNHIGSFLVDDWKKIERKKSPKSKLKLIINAFGCEMDFSEFPFNKFNEIFNYRHSIVHGKTIKTREIVYQKNRTIPFRVSPKMEQMMTSENANTYLNSAKEMIRYLFENSNIELPPIGLFGSSWTSFSETGKRPPKKDKK